MKLAKYGKRQCLAATFLMFAAALLAFVFMYFSLPGGVLLLVFSLIFWGTFLAFFRDPHRVVGQDKKEIVSPADGVIKDVELIPNASCEDETLQKLFSGYDILRIGIVQSLFDVHINRAPCSMKTVSRILREKEKKNSAEYNWILLAGTGKVDETFFPVAICQLSHCAVRNIICDAQADQEMKKGEVYGMIPSSSRVELYLPAKTPISITAATGTRVLAGKTVLAVCSGEKNQ